MTHRDEYTIARELRAAAESGCNPAAYRQAAEAFEAIGMSTAAAAMRQKEAHYSAPDMPLVKLRAMKYGAEAAQARRGEMSARDWQYLEQAARNPMNEQQREDTAGWWWTGYWRAMEAEAVAA